MRYIVTAAKSIPLDDMEQVHAFYKSYLSTDGFAADSVIRLVYARDPVTSLLSIPAKHQMLMLDEVIHAPDGTVAMTQKLFFLPDYYEIALTRKNDRTIKQTAQRAPLNINYEE
jgi:DNA-binding GntR family transcriptional regulator